MGIEAATYIKDLVSTNPTGSDGKAEGDNHLRLIKAVLLSSFPNIDAAMTVSSATLNSLPALATGALQKSGGSMTGPIVLAADATATMHPTTKQQVDAAIVAATAALIPAGAVLAFAKSAVPSGWLKCDGAEVSRTGATAGLFAAIGTTYGVGNGSTTFNLPDLRGEFIRGWDDARAVDTGRVFGSAQSDEIKLHGHPYRSGTASVSSPDGTGGFQREGGNATNYSAYTGTPSATAGQQIGGTGGTETRPRNIAMMYCIKT